MLTDAIIKALPKIKEMGREEIAKSHALGVSAAISRRQGEITLLHADGSETTQQHISDSIPS